MKRDTLTHRRYSAQTIREHLTFRTQFTPFLHGIARILSLEQSQFERFFKTKEQHCERQSQAFSYLDRHRHSCEHQRLRSRYGLVRLTSADPEVKIARISTDSSQLKSELQRGLRRGFLLSVTNGSGPRNAMAWSS